MKKNVKNKNIVVLKFGGTSMGSAEAMNESSKVVMERISQKKNPFVVVSAVSKVTDALLSCLNFAKNRDRKSLKEKINFIKEKHLDILNNLTKNKDFIKKYSSVITRKIKDVSKILDGVYLSGDYSSKIYALVASYGEDLSSELMELCLIENGVNAKKINSKYLVKTEKNFLSANVNFLSSKRYFSKLIKNINKDTVYVMTGFFGGNDENEVMLLGRGGSDFSASISAISLNAGIVEIWTDADGVMSADPRIVTSARVWNKINKDIASEMARAGAKVIHPKTISASYYDIEIVIKNLFNKSFNGTFINSEKCNDGVFGIVSDDDYSIVHFENQDMFENTGFIAKIGLIAHENNIPLDMVATSETSVTFTIKSNSLSNEIIDIFSIVGIISTVDNLTKISVIGENINNPTNLELIFSALKSENIVPYMTTVGHSNNNIGFIIKKDDRNKALIALHKKLIK